MRKVTLVYLPNSNCLLGTFATGNLTGAKWWVSSGFTNAETVVKGIQIYGEIHLSICKMKNGTWSIFQSKDYAQTWHQVFNTSGKILDIVKINYGWAIINAADGFYETVNAGTTWTKISSLPSASVGALCNIGGGDILVCTDGRYVWRSTDKARTWSRTIDMASADYDMADSSDFCTVQYPAIAGANGQVVAAYRSGIQWSTNWGQHWQHDGGWCNDYSPHPPESLVAGRFKDFCIKQILVGSVTGPTAFDVKFLIRTDDIRPASGTNQLFSRLFQGGCYRGDDERIGFPTVCFQQYLSPDENLNQISSYELPVTGEDHVDRVIMSTQTRIDSATGKMIPSIKYSLNGGTTWTDVNITTFEYGPTGTSASGSFMDENYAKITWSYGGCDNEGQWEYQKQYIRQNLSYDMDWVLSGKRAVPLTSRIAFKSTIGGSVGVTVTVSNDVHYTMDARAQKKISLNYLMRVTVQKLMQKTQSMAVLIIKSGTVTYRSDSLFENRVIHEYSADALCQNTLTKTYQMGVGIYAANTAWLWDHYGPQIFNLIFPDSPVHPFDSRNTTGLYED